uniref:Aquaporin TIP23 n=1 Tax=Robinia pseudoacacia TaxID=35938 RepID=A0A342D227_ROBPS|nr:aquaporin TIP2;3 [Robinia pseudoacacia]
MSPPQFGHRLEHSNPRIGFWGERFSRCSVRDYCDLCIGLHCLCHCSCPQKGLIGHYCTYCYWVHCGCKHLRCWSIQWWFNEPGSFIWPSCGSWKLRLHLDLLGWPIDWRRLGWVGLW